MPSEMLLRRGALVILRKNVRSGHDARRKCDYRVYEYFGDDGKHYRKAFETKRGSAFVPPAVGTHDQLNALKNQL